jgi:hypothetical protein
MFGELEMQDPRFQVTPETNSSGLNIDLATVSISVAVAPIVVELIKSATKLYLEHKKATAPRDIQKAKIELTVHLTLGGRRSVTVNDPEQVALLLDELPSDPAGIRSIELK